MFSLPKNKIHNAVIKMADDKERYNSVADGGCKDDVQSKTVFESNTTLRTSTKTVAVSASVSSILHQAERIYQLKIRRCEFKGCKRTSSDCKIINHSCPEHHAIMKQKSSQKRKELHQIKRMAKKCIMILM